MTMNKLALSLGKSGDYFHIMKIQNPDKYSYIFDKNTDIQTAIMAYEREVEDIFLYMQDLYYSIPKKEFFDLCKKHGLISDKKNCAYTFEGSLFTATEPLRRKFTFVMRLKKFVDGQS